MATKPSRPYVLVNMAMSADGKIATANRSVDTLGTERDQENLLRLRGGVDAVLCGARTAGGSGITLNSGGARYRAARRRRGLAEEPMRVILSGRAGISPRADLFQSEGGPLLVVVSESAPRSRVRRLEAVADEVRCFGARHVDLVALLRWLAVERGVRRLVCEGGAMVNDAMFRAGLVDELHLTVCPMVVGGRLAPTVADGEGVSTLARAARLALWRSRRVGDELFLTYRVVCTSAKETLARLRTSVAMRGNRT